MTSIKVDVTALRNRLKAEEAAASSASSNNNRNNHMLKVEEAGTVAFRVTPYPHSPDPSAEPFITRWYHYGAYGTMYCPNKNEGAECHVCNMAWDKLKQFKGNKEAVRKWAGHLPTKRVLFVGRVRSKDGNEPKFLSLNALSNNKENRNEMSKYFRKIWDWFMDDATCNWMDANDGFDMKLTYTKLDEAKSKHLRGAKCQLSDVDLARSSSKFGTKGEYEEFLSKVPDVDKDVFPRKTTEDTLKALEKLLESEKKNAMSQQKEESRGETPVQVESAPASSSEIPTVNIDDVSEKLDALLSSTKD